MRTLITATAAVAIFLGIGCEVEKVKPVPDGQQQRIQMIQKVVSESYTEAAKQLAAYPVRSEMCRGRINSAQNLAEQAKEAGANSGEMEAVTTKVIIHTMTAYGNMLVTEADQDTTRKSTYIPAVRALADGAIEVERLAAYNPVWGKFSNYR
jgi:hypothetical protein